MTQVDTLLNELSNFSCTDDDCTLAKNFAPQLRFDVREPFFPLTVAYTIFREEKKSPSSKFTIDPEGGIAIEYAIWWDWDIQHLYELEHVWVYLDADQNIKKVAASAHGHLLAMSREDKTLPIEDGRVTVFSEPGKHGFAPEAFWHKNVSERITASCSERAGTGGIHTTNPFGAEAFGNPTPLEHRLAKRYMQKLAFTPTYDFSNIFDLRAVPFLTWEALADWIPRRIKWWREELVRTVPHLRVVCLDSGDTMVDESTEIKDGEVVLEAELIPTADEMVQALQKEGYTLALVADGPRATFENILNKKYGLWDAFSAHAISGDVGVLKPDSQMFKTALDTLNIPEADYSRVVMVGNNLARDIKGANDLGLISIWISWSPRRSKTPTDDSEVPDYTITTPIDLLSLLEKIEVNL